MSFNSSDFLIFFPIVVLIYFLIPQKLKNYWLLIASYYFYMCWNAKYALIILFSTIVTYLSGLALDTLQQRSADPLITRKKKIVVAISVLLNLSLLFYFKYINFAIGILGNALSVFHIQPIFHLSIFFFLSASLSIPFRHWDIRSMFTVEIPVLKRIFFSMHFLYHSFRSWSPVQSNVPATCCNSLPHHISLIRMKPKAVFY